MGMLIKCTQGQPFGKPRHIKLWYLISSLGSFVKFNLLSTPDGAFTMQPHCFLLIEVRVYSKGVDLLHGDRQSD